MKAHVTFEFGEDPMFEIEARVETWPATGPTYSSGGEPGGAECEIIKVSRIVTDSKGVLIAMTPIPLAMFETVMGPAIMGDVDEAAFQAAEDAA